MKLSVKVGLVTGVGSGIGRATVPAIAREGASVAVNDINLESASEVVAEVEQ